MPSKDQIKAAMNTLGPEATAIAKDIAALRMENTLLKRQSAALQEGYDNMFNIILALLAKAPNRELFVMAQDEVILRNEWRFTTTTNENGDVFIKLVTFAD